MVTEVSPCCFCLSPIGCFLAVSRVFLFVTVHGCVTSFVSPDVPPYFLASACAFPVPHHHSPGTLFKCLASLTTMTVVFGHWEDRSAVGPAVQHCGQKIMGSEGWGREGWRPEGWGSKGWDPKVVGGPKGGEPTFRACFSPSPAPFWFFFFFLGRSSRGIVASGRQIARWGFTK